MGRQVVAETEELCSIRGGLARPQLEQKRTRRGVRAAQNHESVRQSRLTGSCSRRGGRISGCSCGCGATSRNRTRTDKAGGRGGGARTTSCISSTRARWRVATSGGRRATKFGGRGGGGGTTSSVSSTHARWRVAASGGRRATKVGGRGGGACTINTSAAPRA